MYNKLRMMSAMTGNQPALSSACAATSPTWKVIWALRLQQHHPTALHVCKRYMPYALVSVCSLKCDVVMRHTPLAIAVSSMHFSLKWHRILEHMPGGAQWYTRYTVSEDQIFGQIP